MTLSVQEMAALQTEKIVRDLILAVQGTPAERLTWQPLGLGRTILDQLNECIIANAKWARVLVAHTWVVLTEDEIAALEVSDVEGVIALLRQTSMALATAIRELRDEDMTLLLPLPWKPEVSRTLGETCLHAYWNMAYHEGQISYIQTLYGDTEEYADSGPFGE